MKAFILCLLSFIFSITGSFGQWTGVIVGKLPQLAYSAGQDRLGSAKMGYIDTGILLPVIDSGNGLYHLQLSKNHTAYLDRTMLRVISDSSMRQPAITESWSAKGDENFDYVTISLSRKVAYKSWIDLNPARIMLDLYAVQSNTNWITQLRSCKEVKNIAFEQTEDDVIRVAIELKHQQPWGYSIGYKGKSLQLMIRHLPNKHHIRNLLVAIDAGHGGTNTGADGIASHILEKNYTILFAEQLQRLLLRHHATVIMTRSTDTTIDNKDRVLLVQQSWPDLFVSFHLNSSSRPTARGVSTYYKHVAYRAFTQALLKRLLQVPDLKEFGNVGNFNFQPIQPTECISSLVEVAFLSSPEDEQMILDPRFRKKVAKQVYKGMKDFLKKL